MSRAPFPVRTGRRARRALPALATLVGLGALAATAASAPDPYPLDGAERTGIRRLEAYRRILAGEMPGNLRLPAGAMLRSDQVVLRLAGAARDWDPAPGTPVDPELQRVLETAIGDAHPSYRAALVDITDPERPRWAAITPDEGYIPGSVGKILVMTGLFEQLRRLYPDDVAARARLLRETRITADDFAMPSAHSIPVVSEDGNSLVNRRVREGDTFTLWEWVDHMVSPSSNSAASMVWKQILLMDEFGSSYPPSPEQAAAFFAETPKDELTDRSTRLIEEPLAAAGLDPEGLHIRTFFTRGARKYVPGRGSLATPRQLARWMVRLEQGRLVDEWSSLEMKRLIYFTRRRYRYASSPALNDAAVYFKSGSLYSCMEEEGYECVQYRGNRRNLMHSVAIVESPAGSETPRVYLVSIMSNVLKVNSAVEHQSIGTRLERGIEELHR